MKNKKKECTMYKFIRMAFRSWVLMAVLVMPLSGVLSSCSSDDDDTPGIEESQYNGYLLINGKKWYNHIATSYSCTFGNNVPGKASISIYLYSKEWDGYSKEWDGDRISIFLGNLLSPAELSKGQILNPSGELLQNSASISLKNKYYTLDWVSGNMIFQNYDSQRQKVKLSVEDVVLSNASQDVTYKVKGDIEIDYKAYYYYY